MGLFYTNEFIRQVLFDLLEGDRSKSAGQTLTDDLILRILLIEDGCPYYKDNTKPKAKKTGEMEVAYKEVFP